MSSRRTNLVVGAIVMIVFGLIAVALAIGAEYGDRRGAERAQRFSATWLASTEAAVQEVFTAGGMIHIAENADGTWTAMVDHQHRAFAGRGSTKDEAIFAAVANWKGL